MSIYYKFKDYSEYIPLFLLGLIFISETEINKHAVIMSCNMLIYIVALIIFFIMIIEFKYKKSTAIYIVLILWCVMVYYKKCLFKNMLKV